MVVIEEADRLAKELEGVRRSRSQGRLQWRYQGRLVARQLDEEHLVIRADFDYRGRRNRGSHAERRIMRKPAWPPLVLAESLHCPSVLVSRDPPVRDGIGQDRAGWNGCSHSVPIRR
jgi:hypothetical protein